MEEESLLGYCLCSLLMCLLRVVNTAEQLCCCLLCGLRGCAISPGCALHPLLLLLLASGSGVPG